MIYLRIYNFCVVSTIIQHRYLCIKINICTSYCYITYYYNIIRSYYYHFNLAILLTRLPICLHLFSLYTFKYILLLDKLYYTRILAADTMRRPYILSAKMYSDVLYGSMHTHHRMGPCLRHLIREVIDYGVYIIYVLLFCRIN